MPELIMVKVMPESFGFSSLTSPQNPLHLSTTDSREDSITRMHLNHISDTVAEYGAHHPCVADSQNTLGLIYHHVLHNEGRSFLCHLTALRNLLICYEKTQHRNDKVVIQISTTIHDLGNAHWSRGNRGKAIDAYTEALGLLLGIGLTSSHPRYLSLANRLSLFCRESPKELCPIIIGDELILSKQFCSF